MKRIVIFYLALISFSISNQLGAQEEISMQMGDNFSLEGALEQLKNSASLEEFEKQLNEEDTNVNNLNLNDDDEVDYIRVQEYMEGDIHVIVLQALISDEESQDVATIDIEKTGEESATLQIVGDEDLYGMDYFIEPFDEVATSDGKGGPSADYWVSPVIVNVWLWPSIRSIYRPNYVVYHSPYRWRQYPRNWIVRRPSTYSVYHGKKLRYNHNYRTVKTPRIISARRIYNPYRKRSAVVARKSSSRSAAGTKRSKNSSVTKNRSVKNNKTTKKTSKKTSKNNGTKRKKNRKN